MATEVKSTEVDASEASVVARLGVRDRARQFSYIAKAGGAAPKGPNASPGGVTQPVGASAAAVGDPHHGAVETLISDGDEYRSSTQYIVGTLTVEERRFLLAAVRCDYQVIAKALHDKRQLIHVRCPFSGNTVMHFAAHNGNLDCIKLYVSTIMQENLSAVSDLVNSRNRSGMTPLHVASLAGNADACELLSNTYKADAEMRDYAGRRPRAYQNVVQRRTAKAMQRGLPTPLPNDRSMYQVSRSETMKHGTLPAGATILAGNTATLTHSTAPEAPAQASDKAPLRSVSTLRSRPLRSTVDRSTIVHVHNPGMGLHAVPVANDMIDSSRSADAKSPANPDADSPSVTPTVTRVKRPAALQTTPSMMKSTPKPQASPADASRGEVVEEHLAGASALRQAREKRTPPKQKETIDEPTATLTIPEAIVPVAAATIEAEPLVLRHEAMTVHEAYAPQELAARLSVAPVLVRPLQINFEADEIHAEDPAESSAASAVESPADSSKSSTEPESPEESDVKAAVAESGGTRSYILADQPIAEEDEEEEAEEEEEEEEEGEEHEQQQQQQQTDGATSEEHELSDTPEENVEPEKIVAEDAELSIADRDRDPEGGAPKSETRPVLRQRNSFAKAFTSDEDGSPSEPQPPTIAAAIPLADHESDTPTSDESPSSDHHVTIPTQHEEEVGDHGDQTEEDEEESESEAEHEVSAPTIAILKHEEATSAVSEDDEADDFGVKFLRRERVHTAESQSIDSGSAASAVQAAATSSRSTLNSSASSRRETNI